MEDIKINIQMYSSIFFRNFCHFFKVILRQTLVNVSKNGATEYGE